MAAHSSAAALRLHPAVRIVRPAVLCVPYVLVATSYGMFRWTWFALYLLLLPVVISWLLYLASLADPDQRRLAGFLVLLVLGLAVDLRCSEPAWLPRLAVFSKMLLLDAAIRRLSRDPATEVWASICGFVSAILGFGLREFAFYTPIAIGAGIEWASAPTVSFRRCPRAVAAWVFAFFFIAVPEEPSAAGCRTCWRGALGEDGRWR